MSLEKVYDYFRNYDSETYQVFACGAEAPSEEDIKAFEKQYNINLPKDFREFTMSALGGLYMEVREEIWPTAKVYDVAPFWEFCRGIMVYGISKDIPEYLDLRVKTKELHEEGYTDYLPFFSVIGDGEEIFCFDREGRIVVFNWYEAKPVEGDFQSFLLNKIDELEERKERKLKQLEERKERKFKQLKERNSKK
ncbi:hypothetical protein HMPREF0380_01179 [Eubacterium infirmum F0142]|nr:hypothetical protein HMPREF0380_01179 [Eubacterium infirmum F0142]